MGERGWFPALVLMVLMLFSPRGGTEAGESGQVAPCGTCHRSDLLLFRDVQQPECRICHGEPDNIPTPRSIAGTEGFQPTLVSENEAIVSQEMVYIPEGEFLMGNNGRNSSEGSGDEDEQPLHRVYLKGYWMDRYEVTNAMYEAFVKATGHRTPKHWDQGHYPSQKANHPVVYVDWHDADAYCRWAGERLPTEEEWEKAARGTDGRVFPWGNQFDVKKANTPQYWLTQGKEGGTLPVGSFEAGKSPYGLYDMAGNVYEWTSSWYKPYPGNKVFNMHYGEVNKVLRGGSWYDCLSYGCGLSSPAYNRSRFTPQVRNKGFGFRCARSEAG